VLLTRCAETLKGNWNTIKLVSVCGQVRCVIEHVHTMPKQGISSTGKFMLNYGAWLGMLAASTIPYQQARPQGWMKHFGAMPKDKKARKTHILHLAQQRFPDATIPLALADAVMLAVYAQETDKT